MIHPHEITIGSLLRTNEGEIIRVETITSKAKNRKVGYHPKGRPTYMRYVRLAQCEGIELTPEILEKMGWKFKQDKHNFMTKYDLWNNGKNLWMEWDIDNHNINILQQYDNLEAYNLTISKVIIPCVFFHQLQFALICAGLHELADKIKI